jgi:hypothetical protein
VASALAANNLASAAVAALAAVAEDLAISSNNSARAGSIPQVSDNVPVAGRVWRIHRGETAINRGPSTRRLGAIVVVIEVTMNAGVIGLALAAA